MGHNNNSSGVLVALAKQCGQDSHRWFPETADDLGFMALAMSGEVGEVANCVKKVLRGSTSLKDAKTKNELVMEMTDVFIYLMDLADLLGVDMEVAYSVKRAENEKRFGNGSSTR